MTLVIAKIEDEQSMASPLVACVNTRLTPVVSSVISLVRADCAPKTSVFKASRECLSIIMRGDSHSSQDSCSPSEPAVPGRL